MSNDKKLVRKADGMVAGVASGLGEFTGIDVTLLRVLFVVFTIFGGAGLIIYLVMWIVVPKESAATSVAEDVAGNVKAEPEATEEE